MPDKFKKLIKKISKLDTMVPQPPWVESVVVAVGGLSSIGFDRNSDILLVVSTQGRGIVDCLSGQKLTRDHEEYYEDARHLEADGIGALEGQKIRISGLYGGGLPQFTSDGWSLEKITLAWPEQTLFLAEPGSSIYGGLHGRPDNFRKIYSDSEIRAQGFSPTGRTLVIATSGTLYVYTRNDIGEGVT